MSTTKRKIILKKLSSLNTVWHPESGLVFKSQKERLVIGSYVNDTLVDLDEDSLALCEEWNFKPDESLLANEEEEEPEEEEPEEEEPEEEEPEEEQSNDEPEEEQSKEEPEEEQSDKVLEKEKDSVKLTNNDGETISFIKQLSDNLVNELVPIVEKLQKELDNKNEQVKSLNEKLSTKTKEYDELEEKYKMMDQKFKTMKSLFT